MDTKLGSVLQRSRVDDLRSPRELAQIAYGVGVELGDGSLRDLSEVPRNSERQRAIASLARLERRIQNKMGRARHRVVGRMGRVRAMSTRAPALP